MKIRAQNYSLIAKCKSYGCLLELLRLKITLIGVKTRKRLRSKHRVSSKPGIQVRWYNGFRYLDLNSIHLIQSVHMMACSKGVRLNWLPINFLSGLPC